MQSIPENGKIRKGIQFILPSTYNVNFKDMYFIEMIWRNKIIGTVYSLFITKIVSKRLVNQ